MVFVTAGSAFEPIAVFVLSLVDVQLINVVDKAKKLGITNNATFLIIGDLILTVSLNILDLQVKLISDLKKINQILNKLISAFQSTCDV
ncbi:hypothetical protein [Nostoc sp.]|uniref:hypothetical protein n=1 Tax=Nostoc sp. TaxID=1180 RepID=UPI002FF47A3E